MSNTVYFNPQFIHPITNLPVANGLLYTYITGGETELRTYTDYTVSELAPNPIPLDEYGRCNIYLIVDSDISHGIYRFDLFDSDMVRVPGYPVDFVSF